MEVTLQQLVAQGRPEAQRQSFFLKAKPYLLAKTAKKEQNACCILLGPIRCVLAVCEPDFRRCVHCRFCTWVGSGIALVVAVRVNPWSAEVIFQLSDVLIGFCL